MSITESVYELGMSPSACVFILNVKSRITDVTLAVTIMNCPVRHRFMARTQITLVQHVQTGSDEVQ
jgi:hypothetical protein